MNSKKLITYLSKRNTHSKAGFTLVEIMIVLAIIMVLIGFAVNRMAGVGDAAKITRADADIGNIAAAIRVYESGNLQPPSSSQGLNALVNRPSPAPRRWTQLMDSVPLDPWGIEYQYRYPGKKNPKGFDLFSKGPDRIENTEDDIGNWDN
ncbi:MAG: type II secretion system major pseudopilin GspG [Verrucomicrobiota bacterium]